MKAQELKKQAWKRVRNLIIGWIVFLIGFAVVVPTYGYIAIGYEYRMEVRSHMENAYYANTPELMIQELEGAKQGMINLGLNERLYGSLLPWEQTPNNQMSYQYKHIDSIINRAKDVQIWRARQQAQGTTETTDVYEEKMDNLRYFIKEEGWSDNIAEDAFYANQHPIYTYVTPLIWVISLIVAIPYCWRQMYRYSEMPHY